MRSSLMRKPGPCAWNARYSVSYSGLASFTPGMGLLSAGIARGGDRRALDAVTLERARDEARRLHLLDEVAHVPRPGVAALLRRHRLVDDHESPGEQAHAADALRVGLELLLHAGGDVEVLPEREVDDLGRGGRAHERGALDLAREEQIVGA